MKRMYADTPGGSFDALGFGHLPFRQAVRHGNVVYLSGQVAVGDRPGNMPNQARIAMENMKQVLAQVGATMADVVKTTIYSVGLDGWEESAAIHGEYFPNGVASTSVVVPALVDPRFRIEIEATAIVGAPKSVADRPGPAPLGASRPVRHAVRCGNTIYVSGQVAADEHGHVLHPGDMPQQARVAMQNLEKVLAEFGASMEDVVHTNVYHVGAEGWREAAEVRGQFFKGWRETTEVRGQFFKIGSTTTGVAVPRLVEPGFLILIDAIAVVDTPRRYADPPTLNVVEHLKLNAPFRQGVKCGDMILISGQVALGEDGKALYPGDVARQTRVAMGNIKAVLAEFGATPEDVLRKNTYYVGLNDWRKTVPIRAEYFREGVCATGVAVDSVIVPELLIEMEVVAMV